MKKTLIAVAALAATGAFAQNVTISGNLDQTVYNMGTSGAATNGWLSNGNSSSFWALNGSEDLGGGLKASFTAVSELNLMSGQTGSGSTGSAAATAQSPELFNRGLNVAVQSSFGTVTIGRQADAFFAMGGGFNTSNSNSFGSGNLYANANNSTGVRTIQGGGAATGWTSTNAGRTGTATAFASGVGYTSPNLAGFQASFQVLKANYSDGGDSTGNAWSVSYMNGPLKLGVASSAKNDNAGNSNSWVDTFYGASYKFGDFTVTGNVLKVTFNNNMSANDNQTGYSLGLNYVISPTMDVSVAYGILKDDIVDTNKATSLGVTGRYKLSARTQVYAGLGSMKNEGLSQYGSVFGAGAVGTADRDSTVMSYMFGLKHTF